MIYDYNDISKFHNDKNWDGQLATAGSGDCPDSALTSCRDTAALFIGCRAAGRSGEDSQMAGEDLFYATFEAFDQSLAGHPAMKDVRATGHNLGSATMLPAVPGHTVAAIRPRMPIAAR